MTSFGKQRKIFSCLCFMEKEIISKVYIQTYVNADTHMFACKRMCACVCTHTLTHGILKVFPVTLSHAQPAFHFPTLKLVTITSCLVFIVVV